MIDKKRIIYLTKIFVTTAFIVILITSCDSAKNNVSNNIVDKANINEPTQQGPTSNSDSFDVDVNIHYRIFLNEKVKGVDPNIIKATRQALFDYDCSNAKLSHYNGYSVDYDVLILRVIEIGNDTWEVRFYETQHSGQIYSDEFSTNDSIPYSFATVVKQASGTCEGNIVNPGGPNIVYGETY